jgi:ubiquinone biosynthesis protein UbiJ
MPEIDELVQEVRRLVQPKLERRVEQVLYRLVGELIAQRWSSISTDLAVEVNELIDQSVRDALARRSANKP